MILIGMASVLNLLFYFFRQEFRGNIFLYSMLAVTIVYGVLRKLYMWYNYLNISVPPKKTAIPDLKVDILTTYYPGEPRQMVVTTLEAISKITYPHTAYLCDEANDDFLRDFCKRNGIVHVTRDNRVNAKAGNINNALKTKATGDICVILDPDHIPQPNFLNVVLPHFDDPKTGFVQIVQSYYNTRETLVARGAAEQTFQFYGPMMMTLNSYGAVNAIGANCVFRREALDSIGGHAPGLCEDMHTAMLLYSEKWKAVYLPVVLARGLAPSNITTFFKQQLKWSRGTFDLLVSVYPKIFKSLTMRQKIHFGILPLHYLSGLICLFNFLIPILSLLFYTTPWVGNIIDFGLVLLPVAASSIFIRFFIQKWVIEKKERGFHLIGGLLHINTWYVHLIGLFYTIINKKVPYLPTPKEDEFNTNFRIIIPNLVVAIASILSVIIGLNIDFTPFSLMMSLFALFNAFIMGFGVYMTVRVTNQNHFIRKRLKTEVLSEFRKLKIKVFRTGNRVFDITRTIAFPLLAIIFVFSIGFSVKKELSTWDDIEPEYFQQQTSTYFGIFEPSEEGGISNISEIGLIEARENLDFNMISFYLAWNDESVEDFPYDYVNAIYDKDAVPLITWEPWASELSITSGYPKLQQEQKVFQRITEGVFDEYISDFIDILKGYNKPVFLRFAHEFDNPAYPWSYTGNNTAEEFKAAWKYIHRIIQEKNAEEIVLVWNPWQIDKMKDYYPGNEYVDWIGIDLLNYSTLNRSRKSVSFDSLYLPYHDMINSFTRKPVLLAEFGSLDLDGEREQWIEDAWRSIPKYSEISGAVFFNSNVDKNVPNKSRYDEKYLEWKIDDFQKLKPKETDLVLADQIEDFGDSTAVEIPFFKGIRYSKGQNWKESHHPLTIRNVRKDFSLIDENGLHTIQFTGNSIYDHNIMETAKKHDMNLIMEFDLDPQNGFIENPELAELEKEILDAVRTNVSEALIMGYSFRFDLEKYFAPPLLQQQQHAYLNWINTVIEKAKKIDTKRPFLLDLVATNNIGPKLDRFKNEYGFHFDSYGLIITKGLNLKPVISKIPESVPYHISEITAQDYLKNDSLISGKSVLLNQFQDRWESKDVNFEGLITFFDHPKQELKKLRNSIEGKASEKMNRVKILKPAVPLRSGRRQQYRVALYNGENWRLLEEEDSEEYTFKWSVVKTDVFGNGLAVKELESYYFQEITVPKDYKQYYIAVEIKGKNDEYWMTHHSELYLRAEN